MKEISKTAYYVGLNGISALISGEIPKGGILEVIRETLNLRLPLTELEAVLDNALLFRPEWWQRKLWFLRDYEVYQKLSKESDGSYISIGTSYRTYKSQFGTQSNMDILNYLAITSQDQDPISIALKNRLPKWQEPELLPGKHYFYIYHSGSKDKPILTWHNDWAGQPLQRSTVRSLMNGWVGITQENYNRTRFRLETIPHLTVEKVIIMEGG